MNTWDERFLRLAAEIATWSKDPRTKVGCVVVRPDKTIASTGFNGLPRGIADTEERLHNRALKHLLVLHAEENALLTARERLEGTTLYSTVAPCSLCAARIIQSKGVVRVVACKKQPFRCPFCGREGTKLLDVDKYNCSACGVLHHPEILNYEMGAGLFKEAGIAYEEV